MIISRYKRMKYLFFCLFSLKKSHSSKRAVRNFVHTDTIAKWDEMIFSSPAIKWVINLFVNMYKMASPNRLSAVSIHPCFFHQNALVAGQIIDARESLFCRPSVSKALNHFLLLFPFFWKYPYTHTHTNALTVLFFPMRCALSALSPF